MNKLKVIDGDFGRTDKNSEDFIQIHPISDPPKQHKAIGLLPNRVMRDPESIWIDPSFQRNISHRGKWLIHDMVSEWNWHAFSPPAIYIDKDTGLEVAYDGQHTLIGAASRDDILQIPCDLYSSLEEAQQAASAFLKRNTSRIGVSTYARYRAAKRAKQPWAVKLNRLSKTIGFTIPTHAQSGLKLKPDTILSIAALREILDRRGEDELKKIIKPLVGVAITPIREMHLRAIETLLFDSEFKGLVRADRIGAVIRGLNNNLMVRDALTDAITRGWTRHRALANIYLREYQGVYGVR